MIRAVRALKHLKAISLGYTDRIRVVATHAIRQAKNRKAFLDLVRKETGLSLEVIDGVEEARLTCLGVRQGLALGEEPILLVDVGGGSTEIALASGENISFVTSLKLGAVTLTQRFRTGKKGKLDVQALKSEVEAHLAPLSGVKDTMKFRRAIASSGTAKALTTMSPKCDGGFPILDSTDMF